MYEYRYRLRVYVCVRGIIASAGPCFKALFCIVLYSSSASFKSGTPIRGNAPKSEVINVTINSISAVARSPRACKRDGG
jgi:hypothetical protein